MQMCWIQPTSTVCTQHYNTDINVCINVYTMYSGTSLNHEKEVSVYGRLKIILFYVAGTLTKFSLMGGVCVWKVPKIKHAKVYIVFSYYFNINSL